MTVPLSINLIKRVELNEISYIMINQVTRSFNTVTEKKRFIQINLLQKKATCFRKLLHAFVHGDILVLFN